MTLDEAQNDERLIRQFRKRLEDEISAIWLATTTMFCVFDAAYAASPEERDSALDELPSRLADYGADAGKTAQRLITCFLAADDLTIRAFLRHRMVGFDEFFLQHVSEDRET